MQPFFPPFADRDRPPWRLDDLCRELDRGLDPAVCRLFIVDGDAGGEAVEAKASIGTQGSPQGSPQGSLAGGESEDELLRQAEALARGQ